MPLSEKDALEQTVKDREERREQAQKDRDERIQQANNDRRNRTIVASIAAAATILAAYGVALKGIDTLAEKKSSYQIITGPGSLDPAQTAGVYLLNPKTGETWFARRTPDGAEWVRIFPSTSPARPRRDASPTPFSVTPTPP